MPLSAGAAGVLLFKLLSGLNTATCEAGIDIKGFDNNPTTLHRFIPSQEESISS